MKYFFQTGRIHYFHRLEVYISLKNIKFKELYLNDNIYLFSLCENTEICLNKTNCDPLSKSATNR